MFRKKEIKFELYIECYGWDKLGETLPISRWMKVDSLEILQDIVAKKLDPTIERGYFMLFEIQCFVFQKPITEIV